MSGNGSPSWALKALGFVIAALLAVVAWYIRGLADDVRAMRAANVETRIQVEKILTQMERDRGGEPYPLP
jgi:hypothetical protein